MPTSLSVSVDCVDCSALSMIHSHPAPMHQSCTARKRILFIHLRLIILHQYPSVYPDNQQISQQTSATPAT